jgi:hypothetical protein
VFVCPKPVLANQHMVYVKTAFDLIAKLTAVLFFSQGGLSFARWASLKPGRQLLAERDAAAAAAAAAALAAAKS